MKRCSNCGHLSEDASSVCEVCGHLYTAETDRQEGAGTGQAGAAGPGDVIELPGEDLAQAETGDVPRAQSQSSDRESGSREAAKGRMPAADEAASEGRQPDGTEGAADGTKGHSQRKAGGQEAAPQEAEDRMQKAAPQKIENETRKAVPQGAGNGPQKAVPQGAGNGMQRAVPQETGNEMRKAAPQEPGNRPRPTVYGQGAVPPRVAGGREQARNSAPARPRSRIYGQDPSSEAMYGQGRMPGSAYGRDRMPDGANGRGADPQRRASRAGQPRGNAAYGADGQPRGNTAYGADGQPRGNTAYGADSQPRGNTVYGADSQPRGNTAYGAGNQPHGNTAYGPEGQPRGNMSYGPGNQPRGNMPYGSGNQPRGNMPCGPGNQPRGGMRPQYGPQGQPMQRRPGGQPQDMASVRQGFYGHRLMEESRRMLRSPVFILAAALNTVFMVTTIASVFLQGLSYSQVINVLANFDAPSELMMYANRIISLLSNLGDGFIVINLITHLPEVLLCLGFWMLIATSGKKDGEMPGGGFLLGKVYIIIKMIGSCVLLLICLVLSVTFVVSAWVSGSQGAQILSVVFLVVMITVAMMIIMYYFCLLHTIKVCRMNAMEGEDYGSVSRYAAVLLILSALMSVIGWLSAVVNAETAGIVSFTCKIGWMILISVWIFMYRNKMEDGAAEK